MIEIYRGIQPWVTMVQQGQQQGTVFSIIFFFCPPLSLSYPGGTPFEAQEQEVLGSGSRECFLFLFFFFFFLFLFFFFLGGTPSEAQEQEVLGSGREVLWDVGGPWDCAMWNRAATCRAQQPTRRHGKTLEAHQHAGGECRGRGGGGGSGMCGGPCDCAMWNRAATCRGQADQEKTREARRDTEERAGGNKELGI